MGNVAVYKKGTTDFFSQGVGLLSDVVSSNLTQTVSSTGNVEQKLEVEYPIDGYLVSELVEGAILRVSVSTDKSDYGVFEIVDTLKDDSGIITVYGDPYYKRILRMSFDNGGVFTKFSSVQSALNAAKQNIAGFPADFNLISNLSTSVDLSENTYEDFGTFLEALNSAVHGNIKYSLNSIQIYSAIGKDITDITLRDDMNTSSVKITTDFSGIINKVIPVLPILDKDGNATDKTKVGTIVTSKYSNQFLDYWAGKVIQFDTQDLANTYFDRTNADRPVQTVDVDPIGLDDDFSTINIFDTIELYSTRLDYTDKLRVSERVFDTLAENVTSFKLGSSSVNIFNQINEQNDQIFNNVVKLTNAAISANGKGIDYFGQAQPSSPKEGDTWFWDDGTDFGIKQYTNGEWVNLVSSKTAEKITAAVTEAVAQANAHTDEVKQGLSTDIATAKSQAASQANTAEANAKSAATSQFTQAKSALSAAKTDLNNSIASEASARNTAVAAANSQAQTYANQAKADAMSAASSADGVIRTEISSSANSLSATITQNKSSADSGISTAQTTAKAAVDGLQYKVSKTEYDQKTGDLSTKINDVKETADSSAQTIADIKIADGKQDARMTQIESDASGVKTTVSDLQTTQGKQSGDISTLQQMADGFDATVTKINDITDGIGGRNWLLNSSPSRAITGSNKLNYQNSGLYFYLPTGINTGSLYDSWGLNSKFVLSFDWSITGSTISGLFLPQFIGTPWGIGGTNTTVSASNNMGHIVVYGSVTSAWSGTTAIALGFREDYLQGNLVISNIKLEQGVVPTAWTQAPEDVSAASAKAQLTADKASLDLSTYKTDADGRISKAQSGVEANANAITQKVSQTDYDKKTGELSSKLNTTTDTADGTKQALSDYKEYANGNISGLSTDLETLAGKVDLKLTKTDYDSDQSQLNTSLTQWKADYDGWTGTVSKLSDKVNNLGQVNQLFNTEFSPDLQGWNDQTLAKTGVGTFDGSNILDLTNNSDFRQLFIPLNGANVISASVYRKISISGGSGGRWSLMFYGANNAFISSVYGKYQTSLSDFTLEKLENVSVPSGAQSVSLRFYVSGTISIYQITKPMLVFSSNVGAYVQGNYNNNAALAQVKITADSISNFVRDSSGNISSDFQTALGNSSVIVDGNNRMISLVNQKSDEIVAQISSVNLFPNSEFESDYGYEYLSGDVKLSLDYKWVVGSNQNGVVEIRTTASSYQGYYAEKIAVFGGSTISFSTLFHYENGGLANGQAGVDMRFRDKDGNETGKQLKYLPQQSDYWTTILIENIYVPDTSVSLSITLIVNDAGAGQYAVFAQPMLVNSSTIKKYAPNTDITNTLMLLKDKWAIGLSDNIGNITSGIIGDSSSMSLISKNIVLDGNTTVTGDFKVWQANIANGAIGTAQIGDAAITSAKIADLDVSKITGNVTNFIQSYWNGVYGSTTMNANGLSVQSGSMTTLFDSSGAHFSQGTRTAQYSFGNWVDSNNNNTSSVGLYLGLTGDNNSFTNIIGPSGKASIVVAGPNMADGDNSNIVRDSINLFSKTNIRSRLLFKGNGTSAPTYIEADEVKRTLNFYTNNARDGDGNWFWFNHKVLSEGTFSSTSLLSKKNVIANYEEDALSEISKTDIVEFEYKNNVGEKHISPIIDDVNDEKDYYIPETILGQGGEYVDMYSMISMAWKAIKQLNEKIGEK